MFQRLKALAIAGTAGIVLAGVAALGLIFVLSGSPAAAQTVEVWKSQFCGCCGNWVRHMEDAGFTVTVHDTEDLAPIKEAHGVPPDLQSCHTATVEGYVLEGHVPADTVRRLLAEDPSAQGLAVPGMPPSAPGMDTGPGSYAVMLFGTPEGAVVYEQR
jgi:hypothetical protein